MPQLDNTIFTCGPSQLAHRFFRWPGDIDNLETDLHIMIFMGMIEQGWNICLSAFGLGELCVTFGWGPMRVLSIFSMCTRASPEAGVFQSGHRESGITIWRYAGTPPDDECKNCWALMRLQTDADDFDAFDGSSGAGDNSFDSEEHVIWA